MVLHKSLEETLASWSLSGEPKREDLTHIESTVATNIDARESVLVVPGGGGVECLACTGGSNKTLENRAEALCCAQKFLRGTCNANLRSK